jgi:hypothetical protein
LICLIYSSIAINRILCGIQLGINGGSKDSIKEVKAGLVRQPPIGSVPWERK